MAALPLGLMENVHKRLYDYLESGALPPVLRVSRQTREAKSSRPVVERASNGSAGVSKVGGGGIQWSSSPPRLQPRALLSHLPVFGEPPLVPEAADCCARRWSAGINLRPLSSLH